MALVTTTIAAAVGKNEGLVEGSERCSGKMRRGGGEYGKVCKYNASFGAIQWILQMVFI